MRREFKLFTTKTVIIIYNIIWVTVLLFKRYNLPQQASLHPHQAKMANSLGAAVLTFLQNFSIRFYEVIFLLKVSSHRNSLDFHLKYSYNVSTDVSGSVLRLFPQVSSTRQSLNSGLSTCSACSKIVMKMQVTASSTDDPCPSPCYPYSSLILCLLTIHLSTYWKMDGILESLISVSPHFSCMVPAET